VIQRAVDHLFNMILSTEPLRLVCLNCNGIPVFEQSSNGGSVRTSKSINDSVTRIGEHLDKCFMASTGLTAYLTGWLPDLRETGGLGAKLRKEGILGDQWKTTSLGDPNQMMKNTPSRILRDPLFGLSLTKQNCFPPQNHPYSKKEK